MVVAKAMTNRFCLANHVHASFQVLCRGLAR